MQIEKVSLDEINKVILVTVLDDTGVQLTLEVTSHEDLQAQLTSHTQLVSDYNSLKLLEGNVGALDAILQPVQVVPTPA